MKQSIERKNNSGVSFKNDKRTGENSPVETGRFRIGGVDFRGSAWINKSKNGTPYKSWKFEPEADAPKKATHPFNDDISRETF